MIQKNIRELVQYGLLTGLIEEEDRIYTINRLLELFGLDALEECGEQDEVTVDDLERVLGEMLDYAYEKGILSEIGRAHV